MNENRYMYILTEDEKRAVEYAIDYFFESVPYILEGIEVWEDGSQVEALEKKQNTLEALVKRMGAVSNE